MFLRRALAGKPPLGCRVPGDRRWDTKAELPRFLLQTHQSQSQSLPFLPREGKRLDLRRASFEISHHKTTRAKYGFHPRGFQVPKAHCWQIPISLPFIIQIWPLPSLSWTVSPTEVTWSWQPSSFLLKVTAAKNLAAP